jgi:dTDP-4-dehydrorhamnose reductase
LGRAVAVVFGARGTLGGALVPALAGAGWQIAAAPARAECDITNADAVRALVAQARPTTVFNLAAFNDVDRSEREPELAHATNAAGAAIVAAVAAAAGAAVMHYSTDFVFDGARAQPYDERDPPSPIGRYARSKAAGDARVAESNPRHFIVRVGCLYGRGGRNFPSMIIPRLRAGQAVRADRERMASPTWIRDVAAVSIALAATEHHGLYHCTAQGETTWADFACLAAALLGVPVDRVEAVPSGALPLPEIRPRRPILDNRALRAIGLDTLPPWQDALRAFVAEETAAG